MSKHTPGPWNLWTSCSWRRFGALNGGQVCVPTVAHDGHPDLHFPNGGADGPDARLIAAAPDLLEALIWMVENDETNEGDTPMPDHYGQTWNEINAYWLEGLNKARAAIAKATGEGA